LLTSTVLLLIVSPNHVYALDLNLSSTINLSSNTGTATQPRIAATGSNVFAVWTDNTPGNNQIFFAKSTDGGATFGGAINLSNSNGIALVPKIAVSGNNVYIVWHEYRAAVDNYDIYFAKSTDGGAKFSSPVNLSSTTGMSSNAQIAVSGSYVYVVWMDSTIGNGETYYRRSSDSGVTFSSTTNLSNNLGSTGGANSFPQVAVSGSYVYVVWGDDTGNFGSNEVRLLRSTDGGVKFGSVINLSNSASSASDSPQMVVSGGSLYVGWKELLPIPNSPGSYSYHMMYKRSTDNGATFGSTLDLSGNGNYDKQQIAVSGTNVYVVMQGGTSGLTEILLARSTDGGAKFGTLINLSNTALSLSRFPTIAVSGSNVNIAWVETLTLPTTNNEIYFVRSTDGGSTWKPITNFSGNVGSSEDPRIATNPSDNSIYAVWRDVTPGNYDTLFRKAVTQTLQTQLDTTPPIVSITSPINGAAARGIITVSVSASDNVAVSSVQLYVDNVLKATDTSSPYGFSLDTTLYSDGVHAIKVVAKDSSNNQASSQISITMDNTKPVIFKPANIVVEAASSSGTKVTFTVTATDNIKLASGPTCTPASGSIFPLGTTTVTCTAKDAAGNIATASFTVTVRDSKAPTVSITSPTSGSAFKGSATVSVYASDNIGVSKVELYVDGKLSYTRTATPYTFTINNNGQHSIYAKAYDKSGNTAVSNTIQIKIVG